jgi:hypothetical protein
MTEVGSCFNHAPRGPEVAGPKRERAYHADAELRHASTSSQRRRLARSNINHSTALQDGMSGPTLSSWTATHLLLLAVSSFCPTINDSVVGSSCRVSQSAFLASPMSSTDIDMRDLANLLTGHRAPNVGCARHLPLRSQEGVDFGRSWQLASFASETRAGERLPSWCALLA